LTRPKLNGACAEHFAKQPRSTISNRPASQSPSGVVALAGRIQMAPESHSHRSEWDVAGHGDRSSAVIDIQGFSHPRPLNKVIRLHNPSHRRLTQRVCSGGWCDVRDRSEEDRRVVMVGFDALSPEVEMTHLLVGSDDP
jgi:hypothetical protein